MAGISLSFFRWFWLVRVVEPRFRSGAAFLLGFIGNVFNLVIPGAVGGDLIKAAYLVRMDINRTQAVASMVIDRILGLLGLFILAGIAGAFAWPLASRQVRVLIVVVWARCARRLLVLVRDLHAVADARVPAAPRGARPGRGHPPRAEGDVEHVPAPARRRRGLPGRCRVHPRDVGGGLLLGQPGDLPGTLPALGQHFLMVPLTLFTTAVPLPFGALG